MSLTGLKKHVWVLEEAELVSTEKVGRGGVPGHVVVVTATFEDLGERTRVTNVSLFHTPEKRDGMLASGMEQGLNESYERLDELLAKS